MKTIALPFRLLTTAASVVAALFVGFGLWNYYMDAPWTRDGRVRADVAIIAPDVSGLVTQVLVVDNQHVKKGDVLFRIDPERFRLALREAEAQVAAKDATYIQTAADYARYAKLTDLAVTQQRLELAKADAEAAKAAYDQAVADRDLAKLNLDRSQVRASVNGTITNMGLRPGTYVSVGHGALALIDEDTLRVEGYFEETKLPRLHVGSRATIRLMGDDRDLTGHVESIASGIVDRERSDGVNLLADVNPTFSWVRLAQRVPVRIKLDAVPAGEKLVSGRTATISITPDTAQPRHLLTHLWRTLVALI
jgi:multidrug resistance efflux pump